VTANKQEINMQPYQQRVVDEKAQLDDRLTKLNEFLASEKREGLPAAEAGRLVAQAEAMGTYSRILGDRIANFTA
jgi:hypothetical protein